MTAYRWHFDKMSASSMARESLTSEFFSTEAIDGIGEALIREGIQNSLDAGKALRANGKKTTVRIRVAGDGNAVPRENVSKFFEGLQEHLNAVSEPLRNLPAADEECCFLVFEDFGTPGLTGDPKDWRPEKGSENHFHYFFRAEGKSDKGEKDLGRWGVGKQVFRNASKIRSMIGLTVRNDDGRKMLMGSSVLRIHDLEGVRYHPDGWLGRPGDSETPTLPIEDSDFISSFEETFDLQRGDDPGLTVVVPWFDLGLNDKQLIRAVLRGYFWPIIRGQLEVYIEAKDIESILDNRLIRKEVKKIGNDLEEEIVPLLDLTEWAVNLDESDFYRLIPPDTERRWIWSKSLFPENVLQSLRDRFESGENIAIRVPVNVREKGKTPQNSFFDIFLRRDGSDQSGRPVFIREGIIVSDVRAPKTRGVRSLVLAEDGPIAAFLGDSENPAHTEWQHNGHKFAGKYTSGKSDLDFVKRSVHEVVSILCEQDKAEDRTLLAHYFSIPASYEEKETRTRKKKRTGGGGPDPDEPTPPKTRPKPFMIDYIDGGFVVRNADSNGSPPPANLSIRAAYDVRRGNPFQKYHIADFTFARGMSIRTDGATVVRKKENRLKVRIDKPEFRIEVTGFDRRRDVKVDARKQEDDDAGSDA